MHFPLFKLNTDDSINIDINIIDNIININIINNNINININISIIDINIINISINDIHNIGLELQKPSQMQRSR